MTDVDSIHKCVSANVSRKLVEIVAPYSHWELTAEQTEELIRLLKKALYYLK